MPLSINIKNYKSIGGITIADPSPFSVFVGPNASGKSNIFETLDFTNTLLNYSSEAAVRLFGGFETIINRNAKTNSAVIVEVFHDDQKTHSVSVSAGNGNVTHLPQPYPEKDSNISLAGEPETPYGNLPLGKAFEAIPKHPFRNFSRISINNRSIERIEFKDGRKLSTACGNLEKVLMHVLADKQKREDLVDWLALFIPGFENIEVTSEKLSGTDHLFVYEKGNKKPFTGELISDGTYNIIALLTAVYQSDEPQFLCIEQPENGLNPKVVRELVGFFREQCLQNGHYIWLNTHSQTLVRELTTEEIIIVDKIEGLTRIKQIQGMNLHGLGMDEALLSNAIGGGTPW